MQQADELAALSERCDVVAHERDAAAANLRKAERELADVSEYSTKMFRQVRGCWVWVWVGGGAASSRGAWVISLCCMWML